ncbi:MAG TPA: hypothetical protein VFU01_17715 [Gemmatimonadaceae bacterium]|nr:hypothetical protein [Gemmatimonadaceae bacterium]
MTVRRLILLAAGACLLGCGDEPTGPSTLDLRLAALRFAFLERSRVETGDAFGGMAAHQAALALRTGVRPTRVNITVDGVTNEYWALEVEHAFGDDYTLSPVLTLPIVLRHMVAWQGDDPQRVISISVAGDTGTFTLFQQLSLEAPGPGLPSVPFSSGVLFERGGRPFLAASGGARATRPAIGEECPLPPTHRDVVTRVAPIFTPISCARATFFTRFNMVVHQLPAAGTASTAMRTVTMGDHTIEGIRLQYPAMPCLACLDGTR